MPALEVPAENVHPMPMEFVIGEGGTPGDVAERYEDEIESRVPLNDDGVPIST